MHQFAQNTLQCDPMTPPVISPPNPNNLTRTRDVETLHHSIQILLGDHALLLWISLDFVVVIGELRALHLAQELLVMSDNDQLEV